MMNKRIECYPKMKKLITERRIVFDPARETILNLPFINNLVNPPMIDELAFWDNLSKDGLTRRNEKTKEKKMPRVTIAVLQEKIQKLEKENRELDAKLDREYTEEQKRREELTKLLTGEPTIDSMSSFTSTKSTTLKWSEIFFKMGELNSDAAYSCVIEGRENFRNECEGLKLKIQELQKNA